MPRPAILPTLGRMLRRIRDLDERVHARIERNLARRGILYPWWVPLSCFVGQVVCVCLALAFRDALWPVQWLTLALPLVLVAPVIHFVFQGWLPWWLDALGGWIAATWLMFHPVDGVIDMAPALLALVTAELVARDGPRTGSAVAVVSAALIVLATVRTDVTSPEVNLLEVLLGLVVGAMLWWQMRALSAEREARARAWEQATTAERERIAREIHDLVAHSLSVSLLQVTGARHALRDVGDATDPVETAGAVAEADAALADAEQVGRRAMADIRRTVATMAAAPSGERQALPTAADIAALVREMADAGLAVTYDEQGDPARLPASAGLDLYRIAQESLANVAKHGAGSADVRLRCSGADTRLQVVSPLPAGRARSDGRGSGLAGMQARAAQLGATLSVGPVGGTWVVDVRLGGAARREAWLELPCGRSVGKVEPA